MSESTTLTTCAEPLTVLKVQSFRARLLGLHKLKREQRQRTVLWFPDCRSVHSFFLDSAHALAFLDAEFNLLEPQKRMAVNRCYWHAKARHVLELPVFLSYGVRTRFRPR
ncbi:hypothetical protein L1889_05430 [Paenalcaligenes niemegkensis]|uniref:hypothetical protein n=1 Tax=Paenalcaligenes niemegkensis TaxID=2895469 RepID=UPI001EE9656C|nr:hypothetical protein [Paenalcaligenes niemegkensis]MCQ9616211.1 hypothetical protein [Paenalcaligenes niemegkensis]